ncbi:MAG TPA: hypothetical protein PLY05_07505 [Agitococcus sp.]|nr:hypothetical protein [Agitococcus sp.]HNC03185.1 hypothetical protein [Agitococcus sp.]
MRPFLIVLICSLFYVSQTIAEPLNSIEDINILSGDEHDITYYITIKEVNNHWDINSINKDFMTPDDYKSVEILGVSEDLKTIKPAFQKYYGGKKGSFACSKGGEEYTRQRAPDVPNVYNPCESKLTSVNKTKAIVSNTFNTAFRLGLNIATGQVVYSVDTDKAKIKEIIQETQLLEKLKNYIHEQKLASYREEFKTAYSSKKLQSIIEKYQGNDPENLIPSAIERKKTLELKEADEQQKMLEKRKVELEHQAAIDKKKAEIAYQEEVEHRKFIAEQERERQVRYKQLMSDVKSFQATIKMGIQTNCGPVLETKGTLIKVYFPVKDYGNEHWIKKSTLYPSIYPCSFANGRYIEPNVYGAYQEN